MTRPLAALGLVAALVNLGMAADVEARASQDAQTAPEPRYNTSGRDVPLGGPVKDGDFIVGQLDYILTAGDVVLLPRAELLSLLAPRLTPQDLARVEAVFQARDSIAADELAPLGIHFRYDPATFGLILDLDPELRPRQVLSLTGAPIGVTRSPEPPAGFSGYVTAFAVGDYVHDNGFDDDTGFTSPSVYLDSAVRFRGVVLENEASIDEGFAREGTRLIYDDLGRTARYTLGDLEPISRGFSGASPLAGLSMVRTYADLEPGRNVQPTGQRSFTLDRPAVVETVVNGRSVQQTRLTPGSYDIRDFPFAQGGNDVQLIIRDDAGGQTVLSFSINFDRTLLQPGLTEFGLFAGVRSRPGFEGLTYEDDFGASGFYRRGLSETLTAGANFQASTDGGVVGLESSLATSWGVIGADVAASSIDGVGSGVAVNIGYERQFVGAFGEPGALSATVQTISDDFATPGALVASNRFALETGLSLSQSLGGSRYVSVDAFHAVGRGDQVDQTSARAVYGWRTGDRLLWTAEVAYDNRFGANEFGARIGLTYRFSAFSSARAEIDSRRERARVGYQTSRGRGVGAWSASADLEATSAAAGLNAAIYATRNRAELGLSHQTFFDVNEGAISDQRTSARVGAALAFADGSVALSRPIYDSFAMARPHPSLGGAPVYLDPQDGFYTARSGLFGPAVAPDLSAYSPRLLTVDAPDAPPGYDLGPGVAQLLPPYRSGHVLTIGSDYFLSVSGQLVDESGTPLKLWVGEAQEVSRPDRPPIRLFTNGSGRFAIQGLRPGRWRISSVQPGGRVYLFDIPGDADGLVRIGVLTPEAQP